MVSPQPGMQYPASCPADPTGKVTVGAATLFALQSAAYTGGSSWTFSTQYITDMAWDFTVSAISGGTATFGLSRLGADGNYYPIVPLPGTNAIAFGTATTSSYASIDVSDSVAESLPSIPPYVGSTHNVNTTRTQVTLGGTFTSVTFSMSVVGR